jgi:hypothetical protein
VQSHEELSLRGGRAPSLPGSDDEPAACEAGTVRGEDYCFTFTGKLRDGKLHFRLHMQVRLAVRGSLLASPPCSC